MKIVSCPKCDESLFYIHEKENTPNKALLTIKVTCVCGNNFFEKALGKIHLSTNNKYGFTSVDGEHITCYLK